MRSEFWQTLVEYYRAMDFATIAHNGQMRKYNNKPFITHPLRVAERCAFMGLSKHAVIAAVLHDTVEDTGTTLDEIARCFGQDVANLVRELTNEKHDKSVPRAERKRLDRERISKISPTAKIIKLIDRIDNLKEMPDDEDFKKLYAQESLLLLGVLAGTDEFLEAELANLIFGTKNEYLQRF